MNDSNDETERRELARAKRLRKHYERLGFPEPTCFYCGETDPRCLQLDHISGREFDSDLVWPVCANHHAIRTDLQKDHHAKFADPADPLEQAGRFVLGFADYQEMAVNRLRDFGAMLCAEAAERSPRLKRDSDDNDRQGCV